MACLRVDLGANDAFIQAPNQPVAQDGQGHTRHHGNRTNDRSSQIAPQVLQSQANKPAHAAPPHLADHSAIAQMNNPPDPLNHQRIVGAKDKSRLMLFIEPPHQVQDFGSCGRVQIAVGSSAMTKRGFFTRLLQSPHAVAGLPRVERDVGQEVTQPDSDQGFLAGLSSHGTTREPRATSTFSTALNTGIRLKD